MSVCSRIIENDSGEIVNVINNDGSQSEVFKEAINRGISPDTALKMHFEGESSTRKDTFKVDNSLKDYLTSNIELVDNLKGMQGTPLMHKGIIYGYSSDKNYIDLKRLESSAMVSELSDLKGLPNKYKDVKLTHLINSKTLVLNPNFNNTVKTLNSNVYTIINKLKTMQSSIVGNFGSLSNYYLSLKSLFFKDGTFVINPKSLKLSGIYTAGEINNILSDSELQLSIKDNILSLGNLISQEEDLDIVSTPLDLFRVSSQNLNDFGYSDILNPYEVEKTLSPILAGVSDYSSFRELATQIPFEDIQNRLQIEPEYRRQLFNHFSKMNKVKVYTESNGEVLQRNDSSTLLETLDTDIDKSINGKLSYLVNDIDSYLWYSSPKEIKNILKSIEKSSVESGIDLVGLEVSYNSISYDNIVSLLNDYYNFINNPQLNESDVRDFGIIIDNYFNRESNDEIYTYREGSSLVKLVTGIEESQIWEKQPLLKLEDNLYKKVSRSQDPMNYLTNMVTKNPTLIPQKYLDWAVKDKILDWSQLREESNYDRVLQSTSSYIRENRGKDSEDLFLHKVIYQTPLSFETSSTLAFDIDPNSYRYLTTDFITDFYKDYLKNKYGNTEDFKNFYRHFTFTKEGIGLLNNDPLTKQVIKGQLPRYSELVEYIKINKQLSKENLLASDNLDSLADLANLNPSSVKEVIGAYVVESDLLITNNTNFENYLRLDDNIYQKVENKNNISIYSLMSNLNKNSIFNNAVKLKVKPNLEINYLAYSEIFNKNESKVTNEELLDKIKSEKIDKETDC